MSGSSRPKLAVWKFASCDGCQLSLLDCERELPELAERYEIAHFLEATRARVDGPYDMSLVEGSITRPSDVDRIVRIREQSGLVVSIGACATAGGIQALRNLDDVNAFAAAVYPRPELLDVLPTSTPISAHVKVDLELPGCPIDRDQVLEVLAAHLAGRRPVIPGHSVCMECKRRGNPCILVTAGEPCLGPVTRVGCGALCPTHARACYGCFGPAETTATDPLIGRLRELGVADDDVERVFRTFQTGAPAFAQAAVSVRTRKERL